MHLMNSEGLGCALQFMLSQGTDRCESRQLLFLDFSSFSARCADQMYFNAPA